jgi:hypothetical protein
MKNDRLNIIRELHKPRVQAGAEYFALELDVNEKGNVVWGTQTKWTGVASGTPRYELREATVVYPDRMRDLWREMGERCMTVNDIHEFVWFLSWGGNALIRRDVAENKIPDFLKPVPVTQRAGLVGWLDVDQLTDHERQHAPTPKLRMKVISRDQKRCIICGRRPADDVHVQLEVHHVQDWASGGITEMDNLITLCSTCHVGLEPHNDRTLYNLIGVDQFHTPSRGQEQYLERLKRHQVVVARCFQKLKKRSAVSTPKASRSRKV